MQLKLSSVIFFFYISIKFNLNEIKNMQSRQKEKAQNASTNYSNKNYVFFQYMLEKKTQVCRLSLSKL